MAWNNNSARIVRSLLKAIILGRHLYSKDHGSEHGLSKDHNSTAGASSIHDECFLR